MKLFHPAFLSLVPLLSACVNQQGVYEPACMAHEGDRITLADGHFEWQRYTDEIRLGENGEPQNAFPDYPKTGSYRIADGQLELTADNGEQLHRWFIVKQEGRWYLLDGSERDSFKRSGKLPGCALRQVLNDSNS